MQKLGVFFPIIKSKNKPVVWIHAVSVGEVASCEKIIWLMIENGYHVCLSTTTRGGYIKAEKLYDNIDLFYYPLDFARAVNIFINQIKPDVFILVEMEFWPMMMYKITRKKIPIYVISARIGDTEYKNMKRFRWFYKMLFSMVKTFYAQTEEYAERIKTFNLNQNVKVTGNIKLDVEYNNREYEIHKLLPHNPFICAASTHKGEEEIILTAYKSVVNEYPYSIVVAPRNINRAGEIIKICKNLGLTYSIRTHNNKCKDNVYILDTIGELMGVFSKCEFVVMGGSFSKSVGGHNIIEPALLSKTSICGPYMHNFREITTRLLEQRAVIQTGENELEKTLRYAINNKSEIRSMGKRAYDFINKNKGVSKKVFDDIFKSVVTD